MRTKTGQEQPARDTTPARAGASAWALTAETCSGYTTAIPSRPRPLPVSALVPSRSKAWQKGWRPAQLRSPADWSTDDHPRSIRQPATMRRVSQPTACCLPSPMRAAEVTGMRRKCRGEWPEAQSERWAGVAGFAALALCVTSVSAGPRTRAFRARHQRPALRPVPRVGPAAAALQRLARHQIAVSRSSGRS
jgi:hypothetical protein